MSVRLRQGALPGPGKEHGATGHAVCLEQSLDGEETTDGRRTGMSAPAARVKTPESMEMNRIEGKTGREVIVNLFARSSDGLTGFNSCRRAGYADLP